MTPKSSVDLHEYDRARDFFALLPDTHERFLAGKSLGDMMLSARARLYGGGSGSCSGCGEATAIRMMLAATGFVYGAGHIGVVSPAGCHTAAGSTFPFNPYQVSWTNVAQVSGPAEAMGVRAKWDREGHANRRLWVVGADDALFGAGFQSLIRLIESGLDIKVLVLDKSAQSAVGDLGVRLLSYPGTFVAQTTAAHVNHFYKAVLAANAFPGPAVVICYSACVTDHGIPGDAASHEARLAVDCRAFPLFAFDPGAGDQLRQRLDLRGNPAIRDDWYHDPKTVEAVDFLVYARSQQRFAGYGDDHMQALKRRCLGQWRTLREMAGLL